MKKIKKFSYKLSVIRNIFFYVLYVGEYIIYRTDKKIKGGIDVNYIELQNYLDYIYSNYDNPPVNINIQELCGQFQDGQFDLYANALFREIENVEQNIIEEEIRKKKDAETLDYALSERVELLQAIGFEDEAEEFIKHNGEIIEENDIEIPVLKTDYIKYISSGELIEKAPYIASIKVTNLLEFYDRNNKTVNALIDQIQELKEEIKNHPELAEEYQAQISGLKELLLAGRELQDITKEQIEKNMNEFAVEWNKINDFIMQHSDKIGEFEKMEINNVLEKTEANFSKIVEMQKEFNVEKELDDDFLIKSLENDFRRKEED